MNFDLKGFKKVSSDKETTTLRHPNGHEIKVRHKALSPKMRGQLAELPTAKAEGGEIDKDPEVRGALGRMNPRSEKPQDERQKAPQEDNDVQDALGRMNTPRPYAEGGKVDKGPAIDKQAAKEISTGATQSGWQPQQWADNLKSAFATEPKKMAEGGETPESMDQMATDLQQKAAAPQAPVTINIGGSTSQAPAPSPTPDPGGFNAFMQAQGAKPAAPPAPVAIPSDPMGAAYATAMNKQFEAPRPPVPSVAPTLAPQAAPAPIPGASDPYGTQATTDAYMQGLGEERAGVMGQAQAAGMQAQGEQKALAEAQVNQVALADDYKAQRAKLDGDVAALQKDLQSAHIEPKHYFSSLSTGERIGNAIGLILGGIGSGITHTPNAALEFMNNQINRDIEAQKAELGKKENMLSMAMKQYGNLNDATQMTKAFQLDLVSMKMKQAAAAASSPMAKSQALQAIGRIDKESSAIRGQLAMKKTLMAGMQRGQVSPERLVGMVIPEGQKNEAMKELKEVQELAHVGNNMLTAFDRLSELNTLGNRVSSPLQTPREVNALVTPATAELAKSLAGRVTELEMAEFKKAFPLVGDGPDVLASKRANLTRLLGTKMNTPILKGYGIAVPGLEVYNGQGAAAIKESAPIKK